MELEKNPKGRRAVDLYTKQCKSVGSDVVLKDLNRVATKTVTELVGLRTMGYNSGNEIEKAKYNLFVTKI